LPILGASYKHYSQDLSSQTLKNWFVEINQETSKPVSLQPFPGWEQFSGRSGADGGAYTWNGITYKITDTTLYSVSSNGTETSIGAISGTNVSTFAAIFDELVICRDGNVYSYDGATLTKATDADFQSPNFVDLINEQALYDGNSNQFCISDAGILTSINGLNFATAATRPGTLQRVVTFNEIIYVFTDTYAAKWWNTGSGNPPVDRITNDVVQIGLKEPRSIGRNKRYMYWLGTDSAVYRTVNGELSEPGTIPLVTEFFKYNTSGAIGLCYNLRGQDFYQLYFPAENKTWAFNESGGWFEITSGVIEAGVAITSYTENYGKKLIGIGGYLYELKDGLYQASGDPMIRERVSDKITSASLFGAEYAGRMVEHNSISVTAEVVGLLDDAPHMIIGFSDDGGRNYTDVFVEGGELGENSYMWLFELHDLGSSLDRRYRVRISDNVKASIQGGSMEVNLGI